MRTTFKHVRVVIFYPHSLNHTVHLFFVWTRWICSNIPGSTDWPFLYTPILRLGRYVKMSSSLAGHFYSEKCWLP